ncbi:hypothetical protein BJX68DRAFT_271878 [Aspergillus pseudodeflectus]|uniref:Uncharacterized protein n=1 Tax=Aspergillus pseudodeflectus TaxID=176178 RepID=A0ABR4JJ43_9EURO
MKTYNILSCIISVGLGAVLGRDTTSLVFDPDMGHQVLNMTLFSIARLHKGGLHVRVMYFPEYGIARVDEITSNIDHLNDVAAQDAVCVAEPGTCARPSHLGHSSIFMCNQLDHPIQTMCVDLINATTALSTACRFGNDYTYGYMTNTTSGPDSYPYVVALGDDYAFGSHYPRAT